MNHLFISDTTQNNKNIFYIKESLSNLIFNDVKDKFSTDNLRVGLFLDVDEKSNTIAGEELIDKVSDVIAIGYKYNFFKSNLAMGGLNEIERELLITSLISADLKEDKRYIRSKFKQSSEMAIDGFFNFKLANLKRKWQEICGYIPDYFYKDELGDFIRYLVKERNGRKITIVGEKVFDRFGKLLNRHKLIGENQGLKVIKEALLSSSAEVIIKKIPNEADMFYLKEYFADKILFKLEENL
ncbi:MAG: hypothetical protein IKJ19_04605 [Clostridia bacterium]|nr:hypothetical protein [Clostridia bacterium]